MGDDARSVIRISRGSDGPLVLIWFVVGAVVFVFVKRVRRGCCLQDDPRLGLLAGCTDDTGRAVKQAVVEVAECRYCVKGHEHVPSCLWRRGLMEADSRLLRRVSDGRTGEVSLEVIGQKSGATDAELREDAQSRLYLTVCTPVDRRGCAACWGTDHLCEHGMCWHSDQ